MTRIGPTISLKTNTCSLCCDAARFALLPPAWCLTQRLGYTQRGYARLCTGAAGDLDQNFDYSKHLHISASR